ncbi:MAG: sigma-70 family RNA polymerase sigma factor, partial [Verrucomicrobiaceae bacterium]
MQSADATPLFPDTRWSLVLRTRDFTHASKALEELCRTYWYPLYAMARRSGSSHADAEDLTQGFFCCIMQRDLFPRADQRMGKLRSYLLTSFKHFSISEWRKVARCPPS